MYTHNEKKVIISIVVIMAEKRTLTGPFEKKIKLLVFLPIRKDVQLSDLSFTILYSIATVICSSQVSRPPEMLENLCEDVWIVINLNMRRIPPFVQASNIQIVIFKVAVQDCPSDWSALQFTIREATLWQSSNAKQDGLRIDYKLKQEQKLATAIYGCVWQI